MSEHAVSFNEGDIGYVAPPFQAEEYPAFLMELCQRESIKLVITLNDHELPLLARMKPSLAKIGTTAFVANPDVIEICWDKLATNDFLKRSGFAVPTCYTKQEVENGKTPWPLVVKPRFGTASLGVDVARSIDEFELVYRYAQREMEKSALHSQPNGKELLIQKTITGTEFAVDVVNDLDGNFHGCVVKEKLVTRGGDAACVVTRHDKEIEAWCEKFSRSLGHIGNADLDLFRSDQDGELYCLDVNPRFGGAYPFSHLSGVNLPQVIAAWLAGTPAVALDYPEGVVTARTEHYTTLKNIQSVKKHNKVASTC